MTAGRFVQDPAKRAMLLTALYVSQEQKGYLAPEAIQRVADRLGMDAGEVYSTATFYSMFRFEPVGRYVIQVCEGLSCHLAGGAERLAGYLQKKLRIKDGQTTPDGLFTLQVVQCLAACGSSPAMRVNDTLYTQLSEPQVDTILQELAGGAR
jgi:NADH-quinone oxidoreductase E subunit